MKKFNLIKRKPLPSPQKKSACVGQSSEGQVWYIAKHHNKTTYYVCEADVGKGSINWTTIRKNALQFHTESGVHHFIHSYLKKRKDVYLIHAPSEK